MQVKTIDEEDAESLQRVTEKGPIGPLLVSFLASAFIAAEPSTEIATMMAVAGS